MRNTKAVESTSILNCPHKGYFLRLVLVNCYHVLLNFVMNCRSLEKRFYSIISHVHDTVFIHMFCQKKIKKNKETDPLMYPINVSGIKYGS